jgi:N-acyl-D-aspartate/D-glutamate deacylase
VLVTPALAIADITVFDPNTVIDRATCRNPRQPSEGVRYLVVNGEFVIRDGRLIRETFPGRAVRGEVRRVEVSAGNRPARAQRVEGM